MPTKKSQQELQKQPQRPQAETQEQGKRLEIIYLFNHCASCGGSLESQYNREMSSKREALISEKLSCPTCNAQGVKRSYRLH